VGVAHAVGVGFEVGQVFVAFGGFDADEGVAAGGVGEGFDVAVVEVGERVFEPADRVGDDEGEVFGEGVQVFAGVVEVDDLGGGWEALVGEL